MRARSLTGHLPPLALLAGGLLALAACADPPGDGAQVADAELDGAPDADVATDAPAPADADASDAPDVPPDLPVEDATPDADDEPAECEPDAARCTAQGAQRCEAGAWTAPQPCGADAACREGACFPIICQQNAATCLDDATVGICERTGTRFEPFPCPEGGTCRDARCVLGCSPGALACEGPRAQRCLPDGQSWEVLDTCDPELGLECVDGACVLGCAAVSTKAQYIGCDFWGADTPNEFGFSNRFAFVVSNIDPLRTAHVTVQNSSGLSFAEVAVPPREAATLRMPLPRIMNIRQAGVSALAFHIVSDVPINAYQFNPLQHIDDDNQLSPPASNDASLLLPTAALGTEYLAATYAQFGGFEAFLVIVSGFDGNTLRVVPAAPTLAGTLMPALEAGEPWSVVLNAGQLLTLLTRTSGADLTGTEITSSLGVAVFGGVDCTQIPSTAAFCDHIEEALIPVQAWDTHYIAARFQDRGDSADTWRVIASVDGTTFTTEPPQPAPNVLNRGEWVEFESRSDFILTADHPVMLIQYMQGSSEVGLPDLGDPSMLTAVPARQFRRDYVFLVPDTYTEDYITLIYPEGASIELDGAVVDTALGTPIADSPWRVLRIPVIDGRHDIVASEPIGVSVYGYDTNISYAYPAGLDLSADTQ